MKLIATFAAALVAAAAISPAIAAPKAGGDASIPFVNHGGISSWQAPNDNTLYVQSQSGQWFEAKTMGPCPGMSFAMRLGFDTGGTDTFDNFSNVVFGGQRCPVASLTKIAGNPPVKSKVNTATSK
jgi:hypothetical protein